MHNQVQSANDNQAPRPPETVAFLSIDYDEGKPDTFRGVKVAFYDQDHKHIREETFSDWDTALRHASNHADRILALSSVDHYAADLKRQ